jgi:hypothetical protein
MSVTETPTEPVLRYAGLDLATAALRRLKASVALESVEHLIGAEAAPDGSLWIFQGLDAEGRPFRDPEGSGKCVLVLSARSEWSAPNRHNTFEFPRLQVLIYADSTRNEDGSPAIRDAEHKINKIRDVIDTVFHLAGWTEADTFWQDDVLYPLSGETCPPDHPTEPHLEGAWVHSSVRSNPVSITDVPNTQSLTLRAEMLFDIGRD